MLIRFVVSNFLSFNEEKEFNMLAGNFKNHKHHVYSSKKIEILKAAAIYGANGAGKSNLVKAIDFVKDAVNDGFIPNLSDDYKFKLDKTNVDKPMCFEVEFSTDNKVYSYGININHSRILSEWLYESGVTTEDKLIFERKINELGSLQITLANKYIKTKKQQLLVELMQESLLKETELLLCKNDSLKIPELTNVKNWFDNQLVVIYPRSKFSGLINEIINSSKFKVFADNLLETLGTGVSKLDVKTMDFEKFFGDSDEKVKHQIISRVNEKKALGFQFSDGGSAWVAKEGDDIVVKTIVTMHSNNGLDIPFDLNDESDGTKRILDFIPAFDMILQGDNTFIIDEIDQSLHPVLLRSLVEKIMNDDTTKGQLIFTTHESSLLDLDIFRQDEIWFVEKNKELGNSELYSLSDYKPRYDLDIRKGYLKGRFGAIPFLASLTDLNWNEHA